MTLNLAKCDFAKPELTFVGCVIGSVRHGPDPEKVSVVSSMKRPTTKKEVRQMLGFFSYFRTYTGFRFNCLSSHRINEKTST